jgi:hypothetical protein
VPCVGLVEAAYLRYCDAFHFVVHEYKAKSQHRGSCAIVLLSIVSATSEEQTSFVSLWTLTTPFPIASTPVTTNHRKQHSPESSIKSDRSQSSEVANLVDMIHPLRTWSGREHYMYTISPVLGRLYTELPRPAHALS